MNNNQPDAWQANTCRNELAELEQRRADTWASTQPNAIRPEDLAILQLELKSAELRYQQSQLALTPQWSQPPQQAELPQQPHVTTDSQLAYWQLELARADQQLALSNATPQSRPTSQNAQSAYWRWQRAQVDYQSFILSVTPPPTDTPLPTETPTSTPLPTATPRPDEPTSTPLPVADEFSVYAQFGGSVAAVNIVDVSGNSVTVSIIVIVDPDDPLFQNPFAENSAENIPQSAAALSIPADALPSTVIRVSDGDTIAVQFDDGTESPIRMLGVDTPETIHPTKPVECYGPEASNFTKSVIHVGDTVYIEIDPLTGTTDRYDRTLAHVWRSDGTLHNLDLLEQGYAIHNDYGTASVYKLAYQEAERAAQGYLLGRWSECH